MRRTKALAAVLAAIGASLLAAGPAAAADRDRESVVDHIVAKADPSLMEVVVTTRGAHGVPRFDTVKVPTVAAAKRVVDDMLDRPNVVGVEMNRRVFADGWNDPLYSAQWGLFSKRLNMAGIASITRNDTGRPIVAVVDSGVSSHPDLAGKIASGYNAFNGTSSAADDCGHGTHVAGIIGAVVNNGRGIVGMAPRAYIRPVKVLRWQSGLLGGGDCAGDSASVAAGIMWAAGHAHVINLSLGASSPSDAEQEAVNYARRLGRVVVAAAGNFGGGTPNAISFPAGYSGVIGVAALSPIGSPPYWTRASYSNYGPWVDVAAPGSSILSTVPSSNPDCPSSQQSPGGYCYMSGTSMATPHVSAEAALAIQHCRWGGGTVFTKIQTTASKYPGRDAYIGHGVINPIKLLSCR
ncbi:MAG TPA: S8 family serine peptidase [Aeromicrobium sp.]|nr:S8 family serine peptidase [Aeromicrobium sp.]